jgi:hypothetical protein
LNLNFLFKPICQKPYLSNWAAGPTGLLAQPAHLARLSQPARVWVEPPTQPSPSLTHLLLLSSLSLATRSPPPSPGRSGQLRWPTPSPPWAKCSLQHPLPPPPNSFGGCFLYEEIRGWISLRESPLCRRRSLTPPDLITRVAVRLRGDLCVCVHAGGSANCGAPGGAAVKSSLGRAWSAARALPRHAGQVCTWATGEPLLLPIPLLLLSLAMVSDHAGQDQ